MLKALSHVRSVASPCGNSSSSFDLAEVIRGSRHLTAQHQVTKLSSLVKGNSRSIPSMSSIFACKENGAPRKKETKTQKVERTRSLLQNAVQNIRGWSSVSLVTLSSLSVCLPFNLYPFNKVWSLLCRSILQFADQIQTGNTKYQRLHKIPSLSEMRKILPWWATACGIYLC